MPRILSGCLDAAFGLVTEELKSLFEVRDTLTKSSNAAASEKTPKIATLSSLPLAGLIPKLCRLAPTLALDGRLVDVGFYCIPMMFLS
jgi:hypothetical protein